MIESPETAHLLGKRGREFVERNLQWSELISIWVNKLESPPAPARIAADLTKS